MGYSLHIFQNFAGKFKLPGSPNFVFGGKNDLYTVVFRFT